MPLLLKIGGYSPLETLTLTLTLPSSQILSEPIVSSGQSQFAKFIEKLHAADWVQHGYVHFMKQSDDQCPFCQQQLPTDFTSRLAECYDTAYEESIIAVRKLFQSYQEVADQVRHFPRSSDLENAHPEMDTHAYDQALDLLRSKVEANLQTIEQKFASPSLSLKIDDIEPALHTLNRVIAETNKHIDEHNRIIADQKQQREICTQQLWEHLAFLVVPYKSKYDEEQLHTSKAANQANESMQKAKRQSKDLDKKIATLRASVVNTDEVKDLMNRLLRDSGFQGFHLEKHPAHANAYQVIRMNGTVAENLSEGERNFIAFLYFYFLVKGSLDASGDTRGKIVVIDDPVSSMDSSVLFIVAAHIRELISICENNVDHRHNSAQGDYIKQIIILTHNAYFFKEVSYKHLNDYSYASYFLINKMENRSSVTLCVKHSDVALSQQENYSPVLNSYAALWQEYREVDSSITLLNVARQILEHYFIQLCGHTDTDLTKCILQENRDRFITTKEDGSEDQSNLTS